MTEIREIAKEKKTYLDLLLLADEQEDMIDRYLDRGRMYALFEDGTVAAQCVVTNEGSGVLEIKSISVSPEYQGKGYGKKLVGFVRETFGPDYRTLRVGTGDSQLTIPFYEKCGFREAYRIRDFFTEHYDHPIVEAGVLLKDMVVLEQPLPGSGIRLAREEDIPAVCALFDSARAALKAQGVDQWQNGYPAEENVRADLAKGVSYVLKENGKILATACLAFGREPTYEEMLEGAWEADPEIYGFLHRIAVAPEAKGKGVAGKMFDELERQARERGVFVLRGDTHRDNKPMQRVLQKKNFSYRGVILLEDGSERLAYEKILH